jgi:pimeloyl-ACP methyl ester carboxylesterase
VATKGQERIAKMDWGEVEGMLHSGTRDRGGAGDERELREFFGDEEYVELKQLAQQVRATRSRAPLLGTVVVIPGIMGSNLISTSGTDEDLIWVNLVRLAFGRISRLRLTDNGMQDADSGFRVSASIIDKRTYTRLMLTLSARWSVSPFAFDWRKDIKSSADALDAVLRDILKAGDSLPVHLVAHSMGGLVSRYFIHLHKETWDDLRSEGQGGRLIMMGTPNYGSFTIPQVMTGAEKLVQWLARIDLTHSLTQVLDIINTFAGSYQMLPDPAKLPGDVPDIYNRETWGDFPISPVHLSRARAFHEDLRDPATINPDRMTYIAGCNRRTLAGLTSHAPGEFVYVETLDGDGRVPHKLGLLDGVPTYYVEEDHGSLPRNDKVLTAVNQLLTSGTTSALSRQPIAARGFLPEGARWSRSISEHLVGYDLEQFARKATRDELTPEEQRVVEETLTRAFLGGERPAKPLERLKEEKEQAATGKPRLRLKIIVAQGDVTKVKAPVIAVGQYKGVAPAGAVKRLDDKLKYLISAAIKNSMVGSELGQLFFIPVKREQINARAVLLAGMGEEGKFSQDDLRYLMHNVTYAVAALEEDNFATLLIGSGTGNLPLERALRGLLFGVCDAFHALYEEPEAQGLKRMTIVEHDPVRCDRITRMLEIIMKEDSAANLDIKVATEKLPDSGEAPAPKQPIALRPNLGPRITVERDGDVFRFSALTQTAVIPVREVDVQSFFTDGIARDLMFSTNRDEQETYGRLLNTVLLPEDFSEVLNTTEPLTLIVDNNTASFPWEMACFGTPSGSAYFGTNLSLTRQFRTFLSGSPGVSPPLNDTLRVLVIADPAPEPEYQLPGARAEGRAVVRVLNYIKNKWNLKIDVVDRIGETECDPVKILGLILEGGFDVVHYAGHGTFDEKNPTRGGWVFGANSYLTAREIFRARRVPRLIFANACFSAVVNKNRQLGAAEMNRHLAGIAEAFFERGVQNYIGAGWPVQDDLAVDFATTFYEYALTGRLLNVIKLGLDLAEGSKDDSRPIDYLSERTLGQAIRHARERIIHDGSTWGAYHHYGNANDFLLHPDARGEELPDAQDGARQPARKSARKSGAAKRTRKGTPSRAPAKAGKKRRS